MSHIRRARAVPPRRLDNDAVAAAAKQSATDVAKPKHARGRWRCVLILECQVRLLSARGGAAASRGPGWPRAGPRASRSASWSTLCFSICSRCGNDPCRERSRLAAPPRPSAVFAAGVGRKRRGDGRPFVVAGYLLGLRFESGLRIRSARRPLSCWGAMVAGAGRCAAWLSVLKTEQPAARRCGGGA